jgi:HKD family nuclease
MAKADTDRLDLHEALLRRPFDHGVICTFSFDPFFFEKDCLDKLRALSYNGNLSVLVDRGTYDDIVERSGSDRPTQANVRYLLHPVTARGVFHPKIFLFASRERGRLIFGSANFTGGGLYRNAELVGCYDYEAEEDETFVPLFQSAFAFLTRLAEKYPGDALGWKLRWMSEEAPWLLPAEEVRPTDFELLHNLDSPLWEQLVARVMGPVKTLSVVSRYFDKSPAILDKLYEGLKPRKVRIYTQNNTTTLTKDYLSHPLVKDGTVEILLCDYTDEGQHQDLHAKGVAIETEREVLFAYGSANCTSPALMRNSGAGNVEVLLLLKGLTRRALKPEKLFDPGETAVRLKDELTLRTEVREESPESAHHLIRLAETNVHERVLRLKLSLPESLDYDQLVARLALPDESKHVLPLRHLSEDVYAGDLSEELLQKLSEVTSVAQVEAHNAGEVVATSNSLFVVHLQDIRTGRSLRRERSLKEAQQSPARFVEVFGSYLEGGDDEATKSFLDSFNVRVTDIPVPVIYRAVRPVWETERAFMVIHGRPWAISGTVHEAVLKFFDRHHKRLLRHVENRSPEGIPNFLHILLTTGAVLHGQIEHGVAGLRERAGLPLRPEEWSKQRDRLASNFTRYKELLDCLAKQYLAPMSKRYPTAKIREHLAPEAEMLRSLAERVIKLRGELEALRVEKLRVEGVPGRVGVAPLLPSSLFHQSQWPRYERAVTSAQAAVEGLLI